MDKLFITGLPGRWQDWCICFACPIASLRLSLNILENALYLVHNRDDRVTTALPLLPVKQNFQQTPLFMMMPHTDVLSSAEVCLF